MIFMNMEYPGKNYRVQVYDSWLGEEFEPMDNPKNGDKIVYRILGENGLPVEQKTEIYQNGAWVEQGGGSSKTYYIPEQTAVVSLEEPSPLLTTTDEIYSLSNGDEVTVSFNGTEAAATVIVNGLGGKQVEVEIGAYIVSIGLAADSSETTFLNVTDGNYDDVPGTYTVAMYTIEGGGGSDLPMFSVTATSSGTFPPTFTFSDPACEVSYADLLAQIGDGYIIPALLTMTLGNGNVLEYGGNVYNIDGTTLQAKFHETAASDVTLQYTSSGIEAV